MIKSFCTLKIGRFPAKQPDFMWFVIFFFKAKQPDFKWFVIFFLKLTFILEFILVGYSTEHVHTHEYLKWILFFTQNLEVFKFNPLPVSK